MNAHLMLPRRMTNASEIGAAIIFLIETSMMKAFHLKVDAGWRNATSWACGRDREFGSLFSLELKRVNKIADDNY